MTRTWFNSPERLAALEREARAWEGTPFMANSEARGRDGGVDCVRLEHGVYSSLGVIPRLEEIPFQVMDHGQHSDRSLLLEAFSTWSELVVRFARITPCSPANGFGLADLLPGDALCFQAGKVPHHGGIMLAGGWVLHALKPDGVHRMHLAAMIRGRRVLGEISAVFRPRP